MVNGGTMIAIMLDPLIPSIIYIYITMVFDYVLLVVWFILTVVIISLTLDTLTPQLYL